MDGFASYGDGKDYEQAYVARRGGHVLDMLR